MAVVVDQSVRPAPRPGQPGRGAAVRLVLRHRWASLVAALACGASVAAVALMTIGDVWHLPPAPQLVVDATVGFVYPAPPSPTASSTTSPGSPLNPGARSSPG